MSPSSTASLVNNLSLDHWESIAFYLVASQGTLGPPTALLPLLLVSHYVYANTCVKNNARLYARCFRLKFDCSSLQRRLTDRWETDHCLAAELIKRFWALRRMRDQVFTMDDLWACYLMMLENDGRNELHLKWANMKHNLAAMVIARAHAPPQATETDRTVFALAIWLVWMTSSRVTLKAEHPELLNHLSRVLHPLIVAGYQHPSSFAPDTCFRLPLGGPVDFGNRRCSGPPPPTFQTVHYSHALTIAYPIALTSATLLWAMLAEVRQDEQSFPRFSPTWPRNREAANAVNWIGPTLEDIADFHYHVRVQESFDTPIESDTQTGSSEPLSTEAGNSRRYDEDWARLVACHDICLGDTPLRGPVYQVGSLCGRWGGRFMEPHLDAHMDALLGRSSPHEVSLFQKPLYWTLREHHCLNEDEALSVGIHESGVDDILNAWLPRGYIITEVEDAIVVHDPTTGQMARYETFIPGDSVHYSKQACDKLRKGWIPTEDVKEIADNGASSAPAHAILDVVDPNMSRIDDDDQYIDYVEHLSSGVSDILVTGETGPPGDAWGHYRLIGRVRSWDGFIVLLQIPSPTTTHHGQWIFKGYIHDRNFVGRWRETSTTVGTVGLEGSFVVTRRDTS